MNWDYYIGLYGEIAGYVGIAFITSFDYLTHLIGVRADYIFGIGSKGILGIWICLGLIWASKRLSGGKW